MTTEPPNQENWQQRAAELQRLGLAELDRANFASAAQMLLDALTVYEAHADQEQSLAVATYLGFALYEQGDQERAVLVWEEILQSGWDLPTVYALLAKHYSRLGQEDEVKRVYDTLRSIQPREEARAEDAARGPDEDQEPGAIPILSAGLSKPGFRILVADDEHGIRTLIGRFLTQRGYQVELAADGEEALLAILHHNPDLVVLDIYMPKRTGLDILLKIRAEGIDVPIVLISGFADASFVEDGLKLGAEFLPKPLRLRDLEKVVRTILGDPPFADPPGTTA